MIPRPAGWEELNQWQVETPIKKIYLPRKISIFPTKIPISENNVQAQWEMEEGGKAWPARPRGPSAAGENFSKGITSGNV